MKYGCESALETKKCIFRNNSILEGLHEGEGDKTGMSQ